MQPKLRLAAPADSNPVERTGSAHAEFGGRATLVAVEEGTSSMGGR